ncbi:MAG: ABC transporter ATP-binding protein [Firmicutes bacterium]|nr:ABC transporter ATP-binding protein [Bacillota bacterium]MDD4264652.1 ABC transporter ATP-binding protein [Bacillota bacterium]MDD4694274.1 ABC transporter ATP-binding protein [Bacillota bacterium]
MLLRVTNVSKSYFGKQALKNFTYELEYGKIIGLLGPNGSGKSTLLKSIAGLFPVDSGEVLINGQRVGTRTKSQVVYLPEVDPFNQNYKVVDIIRFYETCFKDFDLKKAEELLHELALDKNQVIGSFSKGMRARLKLVLALSRKAPLLLLDEPLSGIDPLSRDTIIKAIAREFNPEKQSIILSTHEVFESESLFDEVVLLEKGHIKWQGNIESLRENSSLKRLLEEVYL